MSESDLFKTCSRCKSVYNTVGGCPVCQEKKSMFPAMHSTGQLVKDTWNAAIEAAAKHCDEMGEEARISLNIRELKK